MHTGMVKTMNTGVWLLQQQIVRQSQERLQQQRLQQQQRTQEHLKRVQDLRKSGDKKNE